MRASSRAYQSAWSTKTSSSFEAKYPKTVRGETSAAAAIWAIVVAA